MNRIILKILEKAAKTDFAKQAMADKADLSAFRERPSPRTILGIVIMGISYIIGWPAIAFLGAASIHLEKPMIAIIGGPVTYGLSHLVFILGMYLAGADYSRIFLRWAARKAVEKYQKDVDKSTRK